MKKVFAWLALVVAVLFAGAYAWRWHLISELKETVLLELDDPDSAEFRYIHLASGWGVQGSILCGDINYKNSYGGYVGYQSFTVYTKPEKKAFILGIRSEGRERTACDAYSEKKPWWWIRW